MSARTRQLITWLLLVPAVAAAGTLELVQTIPLAVSGRIDHLAVDPKGQRLLVAALGNHTVEVIDLAEGKVVHSIDKLGKPQGVAYVATPNALFVADGDHGSLSAFDPNTFSPMQRAGGMPDADNLRYDEANGQLFVGYGDGAIRVFDPAKSTQLADIKLPAHPEAFALAPKSKRLVVNLPDAGAIGVVDLEQQRLAQTWRLEDARANFALALDESGQRVFVASRRPPLILVHDLESGRRVASVPTCGDIDDVFFDRDQGHLYAICGEGYIDIVKQQDPAHYSSLERIATRPGARTGLFVPGLHRLYVAVPRRFGEGAEVRVYAVQP
jgi:DNA-binding beta-propeller fold protein YncE